MFPKKPELSVSIPSKTELLKMVVGLAKHVATIHQFSPSEAQKIALAIDEAITNVIKHSYKNLMSENIKIEFYSAPDGLKISIVFTGVPPILNTMEVDLKKMIKAGKKGGLGVELMKRIMDSVEYETVGNVNTCQLVKWKKKK
ncbi:MAG: ATP-binding protein [bacterium]|nr:ATP-binding protein [bacterium]